MMALSIAVGFLILVAVNIALWKFGFVHSAENPEAVLDTPVKNAKERKAFLKRLDRWKAEGRLTRQEYEHLKTLSESNWD